MTEKKFSVLQYFSEKEAEIMQKAIEIEFQSEIKLPKAVKILALRMAKQIIGE